MDLLFPHLRLSRPLVVIDVETTSLSPSVARVVEVAALKLRPGDRPQMFRTRVNPRERIPPAATAIHTGREHRLAHSAAADVWATARVLDCQIARYPELSADPTNLHRLLVEVDIARRFRRSTDSEIVMGFGKYQQVPLIQVAKRDPGYLEWLLTTDLLDDARNLVRRVLDGLPPKPPVPQSTQPSD